MNSVWVVLVLSLFVEASTYIFRTADPLIPLRGWLSSLHTVLEDLLDCGYCLSFWVTLVVLSTYNLASTEPLKVLEFSNFSLLLNFIFSLFIVHRLSGFIHGARDKYFDKSLDKRYINLLDYDLKGDTEDDSK